MAQDAPATPGTIKVVGNGVAVGSPDIATVEVSIDEFDPILSKALERANTKAAAVIEALQAVIPAENIQTTNFNVWVDQGYDLEGRPNGDFTYQVQHSLQLKTENFDQIEVVLQTALDNGATQVYGLTFGVADSSALETQARMSAVEDARARAQELADILGVTLGAPVAVQEFSGGGGLFPPIANETFAAQSGPAPVPVQPGTYTYNMQVEITFAIEG